MNLSSLCCSLPLAKRIDELGIRVDSYFSYLDGQLAHKHYLPGGGEVGKKYEQFAAPTAGELGQILKEHCNDIEYGFCHGSVSWHFYIKKIDDYVYADTEADIRAQKLIHLKEQGIV